jgi:hypothetical protein
MGEVRYEFKFLIGKPERERPLERARRGWKDSIRTILTEIGWEGPYWIHLAQDMDQWWAL